MNPDLTSLVNASLILSICVPILIVLILFLLLYVVIRDAIASGLRRHHLWLEERSGREGNENSRHVSAGRRSSSE